MDVPVLGPQEPDDSRQVVRSIDEDGYVVFGQVGIQEISYQGRFGALAHSTTLNSIAIGDHYFTLDIDTGMFRIGDDILMTALDDPSSCFMWGEIIDADTVAEPKRIRVYVDDISNLVGDFANWEIQVVARPKPGIEKDTSTSSVDPFGAGPFTFTVTAGKFFPIGGQLLLKPLSDRRVALLGKVLAYNGTSLTVGKTVTNATGSASYNSWAIALLDAPLKYSSAYVEGLQITGPVDGYSPSFPATGTSIRVAAGSIMDETGSELLTLTDDVVKDLDDTWSAKSLSFSTGCVVQVSLSGTVSVSSSTVTGSGTAFSTDFVTSSPGMDGYPFEYHFNIQSTWSSVIETAGTRASAVQNITNNTSMTIDRSYTQASTTYKRNGLVGNFEINADFPNVFAALYFIYIIKNPTTGAVDIAACNQTPTGVPDLPSGYTLYRCLGSIETYADAGVLTYFRLIQPVHAGQANITPAQFLNVPPYALLGSAPLTPIPSGANWITADHQEKTTTVPDDRILLWDSEEFDKFKVAKLRNLGFRERLTANRTYYVRTDGSDSNTGLVNNAGGAFLTIQKAADIVFGSLDLGIYNVTIQIADGTYTAGAAVTTAKIGSGSVTFSGNSGTPANVVVNSVVGFRAITGAIFTVQHMTISASGGNCLNAASSSRISFTNIIFGTASASHIRAEVSAFINAAGNYSITGGAVAHMNVTDCSTVRIQNRTVTLTGTPAFGTAFMIAGTGGQGGVNGNTYSGAATGVRYSATLNAAIDTGGGGATYFPGNAAGSVATGGQYA